MTAVRAAKSSEPSLSLRPIALLETLFDPATIEVIDSGLSAPGTTSGEATGSGVITATGLCNGQPVAAYAQDAAVMAGALGVAQARSICELLDFADTAGLPVVALVESAGARVQEGVDALAGYAEVFRRQVALSGRQPQIAVVLGAAAGGGAYSPALTDFVIVNARSRLFLTGPAIVRDAVGEEVTSEELGGPRVHAANGLAHLTTDDEHGAVRRARHLLGYLAGGSSIGGKAHDQFGIELMVPREPRKAYDIRSVIERVSDRDSWLELQPRWGRNMVIGFARINGAPVGMVANQPRHLGGVLDATASTKAARFVRTCNAFGIPLVVLVDTPGFLPGTKQEHGGVIRHGAKLVHAFAEADVTKVTVVIRKAFGGAYIAMNSKSLGADAVFAWPDARLGVMAARSAVDLVDGKRIQQAGNPAAERRRAEFRYATEQLAVERSADAGHVDAVIAPHTTRVLIADALQSPPRRRPRERHAGNIQL